MDGEQEKQTITKRKTKKEKNVADNSGGLQRIGQKEQNPEKRKKHPKKNVFQDRQKGK